MENEASVSNEIDGIPILCVEELVKTSTSLKREAGEDRRFAEKAIIVTQLVYEAYRMDAEYFSGDFPLSSSFNEC